MATTENAKEDLAKWNNAVAFHAEGKFSEAVDTYRSMHETSARACYNMAVAYTNLGDFKNALMCFTSAVDKDRNLAIAFFQRGTLQLERKNTEDAIADLEMTRMLLRGNPYINYKPLGLFCHLNGFTPLHIKDIIQEINDFMTQSLGDISQHKISQILYNLALAYLFDGDDREFRVLLTEAAHYADYFQREQISDTLKLFEAFRWSHIKPIQLTIEAVFAPPREVTENLDRQQSTKSRKSLVVFAADENDNTPTFHGAKKVDELRRDINQKRSESSRDSVKQKILQKMKSTGDLDIPACIRKNLSLPRQRHSTGSINPDSDVPYKSFKGRKQSKKSSRRDTGATSGKCNYDITDSGEEILPEADNSKINNVLGDSGKAEMNPASIANEDLTTEKQNYTLNKTGVGYKRRFKCKAKSLGDIKRAGNKSLGINHERRSTGDLEKARTKSLLPLERKKKSRTSLKKMITKKLNSESHRQDHNGNLLTVMDGFKAVGDLMTLFVHTDSTIDNNEEMGEVETAVEKHDKNNNEKGYANSLMGCRNSLGSVFGDRSTVVKYALTEACDVLTATVIPTMKEPEMRTSVCKEMKNKSKLKDNALRRTQEMEQQSLKPSLKKRRAPEPPKSIFHSPLFAAGNLLTAIVHQEYENGTEDGTRITEDSKSVKCTAVDVKKIDTIHATLAQPTATTSFSNELNEITYTEGISFDQLDMAFVYPSISKTPTIEDMNNNVMTSKYVSTTCKEPPTPEYVNIKRVTEDIERGAVNKSSEMGMEDISGLVSRDHIDQQENYLVPFQNVKLFKSKKIKKRCAPSYPPPPLRINFQKLRKSKKGHTSKVKSNSLVGNTLLTSGLMLGALVPTAENNNANNLLTENKNKDRTADDNFHKERLDELSHLMEAKCEIGPGETDVGPRETDVEEHEYVNVSESLGECHTYINIWDTCLSENKNQRQAEQEPDVIDEMLRTSSNILKAFVTSSQETRQAFEEFVHKRGTSNTRHVADGNLLDNEYTDDGENDYVNMTGLKD